MQITAFAHEQVVRPDMHLNIQVTRWATVHSGLTFSGQTNPVAFIHPRRYFNGEGLLLFSLTSTVAAGTRIGDLLATAVTMWTRLLDREKALLHAHLPYSLTGGAIHRRRTLAGTAAVTSAALHCSRYTDFDCGSFNSIFQRQFQVIAQVCTFANATASTATTTPEDVTENIAEHIAEIGRAMPAALAVVDACVAKLVVTRLFIGVREDLKGFVCFFEQVFGFLIIRIPIRVVLHGDAAVSFFQLGFRCIPADAEHLIIITF